MVKTILTFILLLSAQLVHAQIAEKYYEEIEFMADIEFFDDFSYEAYAGGCSEFEYYGYYKMEGDTIIFTCAHFIEERPDYKDSSKTKQQACGHRTIIYPPNAFVDTEELLPILMKEKYIYHQDSIQQVGDEYNYHMYTEEYVHKERDY